MWKEQTGVEPQFFESYTGSTTQAQNVVNGSGADVVALSLAPDVDTIADAGLITHDWTTAPDKGMVSSSVVVFDVRPGNPKGIADWNDVATSGTGVLTPDPDQSGGARWNLVSLWGAATRGDVPGISKGDDAAATTLMNGFAANVLAWDSSARGSIQNFEGGNGDVAITYENEVKTAQATTGYLRSTDPTKAAAGDPANGFPAIKDLFTVEDLGGWDELDTTLFGTDGIATQAKANAG
jgi:sulfate transport system substrate-binding protein